MATDNGALEKIVSLLSKHLHGKVRSLRLAVICVLSRGHLLIEDLPGLGKTTLAIGLAKTLGLSLARIQCTSDLLPSDITGLTVYNKNTGEFEFRQGPIFNNIVLVDEINRTTPKTQSALLEGMGEKQVTIEGKTFPLPRPFFVIATQNPAEHFGTFPLPESQLDRFMMRISVGYPPRQAEKEILRGGSTRAGLYSIEPIMDGEEVLRLQESVRQGVYLSEKVLDYIMDIVEATRRSEYLRAGLSPRGALAITYTAKTAAYLNGRDHVIPEDVRALAEHTMTHRLLFREEYEGFDRKEIVRSVLDAIPVPA